MSGNSPDVTPKRIAAFVMSVVMALSMVGMAFVGGAAAQVDQSGTIEVAVDEEVDVGEQVNVGPEETFLLQTDSIVSVNQDGSIAFDDTHITGDNFDSDNGGSGPAFAGVGVEADRTADLLETDEDPSENPVDFLDDIETFQIDGEDDDNLGIDNGGTDDGAYPAVIIELDTKSDFSQISANEDVSSNSDFIVIANVDDEPTVGVGGEDYVAFTIAGDDGSTDNLVDADDKSFNDVVDELVDDEEEDDLQNKNIDRILFASGVGFADQIDDEDDPNEVDFNGFDETVSDLVIDDGDNEAFIHSEKITLNPGEDDEQFFSAIDSDQVEASALDEAESGDEIALANGTFANDEGIEESDTIEIETDDISLTGTDSSAVEDRLDRDGPDPWDDPVNESVIGAQINVTDGDVDSVELDGVTVNDGVDDDPAIAFSDRTAVDAEDKVDSVTLSNTIVWEDSGDSTVVDIATGEDATDIDLSNLAVIDNEPDKVNEGTALQIGVEDEDVSASLDEGSVFQGHEVQVTEVGEDEVLNFDDIFADNTFETDRSQSVVVESADDGTFPENVNTIFGSLESADAVEDDSDLEVDDVTELDMSAGVYDHNDGITLEADEATITGAGEDETLVLVDENEVNLEASNGQTLEDLSVGSTTDDAFGSSLDETAEVVFSPGESDAVVKTESVAINPDDEQDALSVEDGDEITVTDVTVREIDSSGGTLSVINLNDLDAEQSIDVDGLDATITSGNSDITAIDISDTVVEDTVSVDVTNSVVTDETGANIDVSGVDISDIEDEDADTDITVDNNTFTDIGDGTGIEVHQADQSLGQEESPVDELLITDNTITGDDELTGIEIDIQSDGGSIDDLRDRASFLDISDNILAGDSVSGDSEAVLLGEDVDNREADNTRLEDGEETGETRERFSDNELDGFEFILDSSFSESDVERFLDENEFGTLAVAFEGDEATFDNIRGSDADIVYEAGGPVEPGDVAGSVDIAVEEADEFDDAATVLVNDLTLVDDEVSFVDSYDEDTEIEIEDEPGITIESDGDAEDTVVEANLAFTGSGDGTNNNNVFDLTIEGVDDNSADAVVDIEAPNALTAIEHNIIDGTDEDLPGVMIVSDNDVQHIELRHNDIKVDDEDGIILDGSSGDSRDQYEIEYNTLSGADLTSGTGLDLIDIEDDIVEDNGQLTVEDNTFEDFQTQIDTSFNSGDELLEQQFTALIEDNTFEQQVIYENESQYNVAQNDTLQEVETDVEDVANIYGSIDEAANSLSDFEIDDTSESLGELVVNVSEGDYNEVETVDIDDSTTDAHDDGEFDVIFTTVEGDAATIHVEENDGVAFNEPDADGEVNVEFSEIDVHVLSDDDPAINVFVDDLSNPTEVTEISFDEDPDYSGLVTDSDDTGDAGLVIDTVHVDLGTDVEASSDDVNKIEDTDGDTADDIDDTFAGNETIAETVNEFIKPGEFGVETADLKDDDDALTLTEVDVVNAETGVEIAHDDDGEVFYNASDVDATDTGINLADDADGDLYVTDTEITADSGLIDVDTVGVDVDESGSSVGTLLFQEETTITGDYGVQITEDGADDIEFSDATVEGTLETGLTIDDASSPNVDVIEDSTVIGATNATNVVDADTDSLTFQDSTHDAEDGQTALYLSEDLTDDEFDADVEGNAFLGNASDDDGFAIAADTDSVEEDLDVTLNYWGDDSGPEGADSAGLGGILTDTAVYDPFLTDSHEIGVDPTDTEDFAHDVVIPADERTSIGFPATPDDDALEDVFDEELEGSLFEFNQTEQSFERVDNFADGAGVSIEAFDGYVVDSRDKSDTVATIEYPDGSPSNIVDETYEFQEGLNFVSPAQAGTVDQVLFPGGDTDFVLESFGSGDNLYGTGEQTDAGFSDPEDGFGDNFRSDVGDTEVHPHAAYLVIVNEETNEELTVAPQLTGVTADNVEAATDADVGIGANYAIASVSADPVNENTGEFEVDVLVQNLGTETGEEQDVEVSLNAAESDIDGDAGVIDLPASESTDELDPNQAEQVTITVDDDGTDGLDAQLEPGNIITLDVTTDDDEESITIFVESP